MDIISKVTRDAERLLKSLGAEYYVKLPTGKVLHKGLAGYGLQEPKVEKPAAKAAAKSKATGKRKANALGYPMGALAAHFRPFLDTCVKAGDVVSIPVGQFEIKTLRGSVSAWCCTHWGKNTYCTTMNRDKGQVEVMRMVDAKPKEAKVASKANGELKGHAPKFHTVGHGLDALANLTFDDPKN